MSSPSWKLPFKAIYLVQPARRVSLDRGGSSHGLCHSLLVVGFWSLCSQLHSK